MANEQNLIPAKKGDVRNPKGKPKGTIHLTTHIQRLMDDENFETNILDPKVGIKKYKGTPIKAIITVLQTKAIDGDLKAIELLMRFGWSQKVDNEHSGEQKIIVETRRHGQPVEDLYDADNDD